MPLRVLVTCTTVHNPPQETAHKLVEALACAIVGKIPSIKSAGWTSHLATYSVEGRNIRLW